MFHLPFAARKQPPVGGRRRQRIVLGVVAACILAYIPAIGGLFFGAWPFEDDALGLFQPWREFARAALWKGTLPLWNPHIFCGLPFMSNGQTAVLYPPNLLAKAFFEVLAAPVRRPRASGLCVLCTCVTGLAAARR